MPVLLEFALSPGAGGNVMGADVRVLLLLLPRVSLGGLVRDCGLRGVRMCGVWLPRDFSSTGMNHVCCVCVRVYVCM